MFFVFVLMSPPVNKDLQPIPPNFPLPHFGIGHMTALKFICTLLILWNASVEEYEFAGSQLQVRSN